MPVHSLRDRRILGGRRSAHPSLLIGLSLSLDFENGLNLGLDRTGQNPLVNAGAVVSAAGKVGQKAAFFNGSTQSLSHADTVSLQMGAGDLTMGFWLNPLDPSPNGYDVVSKSTDGSPEYQFAWNKFAGQWDWRVGGSTVVLIAAAVLPFVTWSWVELTWVHSTGTAGITINNGTPAMTAGSVISPVTANPFILGGTNGGVLGGDFAGTIDNFNLWQRLLTPTERAFLASGVPGSEYPF